MNNIPITVCYQGMVLKGHANPLQTTDGRTPDSLLIYIQGWCLGTLLYKNKKWIMDKPIDPQFVQSLGKYIYSYIQSLRKMIKVTS